MMWIYNSSGDNNIINNNHRSFDFPGGGVKEDDEHDSSSSSSSSIGNNSDGSAGGGCDSDDEEVQSLFKGSLNNLSDLENALALKRGISTFYSGKSKSYTSLADAVSAPSIQDIVKPEDAYNRKRKNMIAHSVILDKNRSGISKKVAGGESSSPGGSRPPLPLPARHRISPIAINESINSSPRNHCSPWRSYSLSDLQHAGGGGVTAASSFTGNKRDEDD